jgi:hypothetical protein
MTPLRMKMMDEMRLAGLSASTQAVYLTGVRALAAYYRRSPDLLSEDEVRRYLLHLRERGIALGTFKPHHGGIQFLYQRTLDREWALFSKKESVRPSTSGSPASSRMPKFVPFLDASEPPFTGWGFCSCTGAGCGSARPRRWKSPPSTKPIGWFGSSAKATRSAKSQSQRRFSLS